MYYIYCYIDTRNNLKYIGQVIDYREERRQREHIDWATGDTYFDRVIHKYPFAFDYHLIDNAFTLEEANRKEIWWIAFLKTKYPNGYNLTDGGGGSLGYAVLPETKAKISNTLMGHPVSDQTRNKIKDSHDKQPVLCIETGIIYESVMEAERQTGISHGNISKCCRNIYGYKSAGGFTWQYIMENK